MENCRILTTLAEVQGLADEWDALARRSAVYYFSDFAASDSWMKTVGRLENTHYHIVTVRREGRLTGLLPLVVTRKRGLRLMRWVAHDVFYGPVQVFETNEDREALWRAAIASPHYDVAKIKYVFKNSIEEKLISALPSALRVGTDLMTFNTYTPQGGEGWFESLSASTRKDHTRNLNRLGKQGDVSFHVIQRGAVPYDKIEAMIGHKQNWAKSKNKKSGIFESQQFMMNMVSHAEEAGTLVAREMRCNEDTLALELCFSHGDTLYCYMITRNPKWSKFSPGALAMVETAKWAGDNGFKCMHLLEGSDSYKQRFTNGKESFDIYMWARTLRGRLAMSLYKAYLLFRRRL